MNVFTTLNKLTIFLKISGAEWKLKFLPFNTQGAESKLNFPCLKSQEHNQTEIASVGVEATHLVSRAEATHPHYYAYNII